MPAWSQTFTFLDGEWIEGNAPFIGARTHAFWLDQRVRRRASLRGSDPRPRPTLRPPQPFGEDHVAEADHYREGDGRAGERGGEKVRTGGGLYIRPMYWAEQGGATAVQPDPELTRFCLCVYQAPLPQPTGIAITRSPYLKPLGSSAPIEAKAGCLYPNNARALLEARSRGFDNCLLCDMLGNVAELATANVFLAKDGIVMTPMANGTFLNGVTRQRVLQLLRSDGNDAREATLRFPISMRRTRFLSSATSARSLRSGGSTGATCNRGRSTAARANFIGNSPIPDCENTA